MVRFSAGFSDSAPSNGPVKCGTSGGPQGIGSISADFVRGSLRFNGVFSVSIFYCTVFPCPSHQRILFSLVPTSSFLLCTNGFVFPSYRGPPFSIVPTLLPDSSGACRLLPTCTSSRIHRTNFCLLHRTSTASLLEAACLLPLLKTRRTQLPPASITYICTVRHVQ